MKIVFKPCDENAIIGIQIHKKNPGVHLYRDCTVLNRLVFYGSIAGMLYTEPSLS